MIHKSFQKGSRDNFSHTRAKGNIGEDIACRFLARRGFSIVNRNYSKPWGELDIVAIKDKVINFFEVKSVTVGSYAPNSHQPEENVNNLKVRHIRKIVQTYLAEMRRGADEPFLFHVLCVFMDMTTHRARVKMIENIIL